MSSGQESRTASAASSSQDAAASGDDTSHLTELLAVPATRDYLIGMWNRRDFALALPAEQLRTRHQTTLLGNLWHLGNPLLSVLVYYVIFGVVLDTRGEVDNFLLFLVIGVFAYKQSNDALVGGARVIVANSGLMRSFRFPRAILPVSHVVSNLLTFGFELMIIAGVAIVTGEGVSRRWLLLPAVVALHSAFNLGGAFITARLNDGFRDVEQVIPFIMRLLIYASGVMFPIRTLVESAPGWIQTFVAWNPFGAIIDVYRWVFLGSALTPGELVRVVIVSVVVLVVGFRFFVAAEDSYGRG